MVTPFFAHPRSNPELKCLYEISILPYQNGLENYFSGVIEKLNEFFPVPYSALILHDAEKDFLSVEALYGMRREDHPPGCRRGNGVISKVIESLQPMVIQNLSQEPLYQEFITDTRQDEKVRPPMPCVPVLADRIPIGVLTMSPLYGPREELIEDLQFLWMLSMILAPAVKDSHSRGSGSLAKPDSPKLKFSLLEESLETKLTEVLDKLAPYAQSKVHTGIYDDIIGVVERILIRSALQRVDDVQVAAAQLLGINRNTLRKKIKDLRIKRR